MMVCKTHLFAQQDQFIRIFVVVSLECDKMLDIRQRIQIENVNILQILLQFGKKLSHIVSAHRKSIIKR